MAVRDGRYSSELVGGEGKTLGEIKRTRFPRLNRRNRRNVQRNGVSREWRWRISPQARAADTILHFAWVLENHVRAELSSKTDYGDIRVNRARAHVASRRVSIPVASTSVDESALCRPHTLSTFVRARDRSGLSEIASRRAAPSLSGDDSFARSLLLHSICSRGPMALQGFAETYWVILRNSAISYTYVYIWGLRYNKISLLVKY